MSVSDLRSPLRKREARPESEGSSTSGSSGSEEESSCSSLSTSSVIRVPSLKRVTSSGSKGFSLRESFTKPPVVAPSPPKTPHKSDGERLQDSLRLSSSNLSSSLTKSGLTPRKGPGSRGVSPREQPGKSSPLSGSLSMLKMAVMKDSDTAQAKRLGQSNGSQSDSPLPRREPISLRESTSLSSSRRPETKESLGNRLKQSVRSLKGKQSEYWNKQQGSVPYNPKDEQTKTLSNKFKIHAAHASHPKDSLRMVLFVNVGSINETEEEKGFAHIVEHLVYQCETHYEDIDKYMRKRGMEIGADCNAETSHDFTRYFFEVDFRDKEVTPGSKSERVLQEMVHLLYLWATQLDFSEEHLQSELSVIDNEEGLLCHHENLPWCHKEDSYQWTGTSYADHFPMGDRPVRHRATREKLLNFYHKWYRPDRMTLLVSGNIRNFDRLFDIVSKKFENIPLVHPDVQPGVLPDPFQLGAVLKQQFEPKLFVEVRSEPMFKGGALVKWHSYLPRRNTALNDNVREVLSVSLLTFLLQKWMSHNEMKLIKYGGTSTVSDISSNNLAYFNTTRVSISTETNDPAKQLENIETLLSVAFAGIQFCYHSPPGPADLEWLFSVVDCFADSKFNPSLHDVIDNMISDLRGWGSALDWTDEDAVKLCDELKTTFSNTDWLLSSFANFFRTSRLVVILPTSCEALAAKVPAMWKNARSSPFYAPLDRGEPSIFSSPEFADLKEDHKPLADTLSQEEVSFWFNETSDVTIKVQFKETLDKNDSTELGTSLHCRSQMFQLPCVLTEFCESQERGLAARFAGPLFSSLGFGPVDIFQLAPHVLLGEFRNNWVDNEFELINPIYSVAGVEKLLQVFWHLFQSRTPLDPQRVAEIKDVLIHHYDHDKKEEENGEMAYSKEITKFTYKGTPLLDDADPHKWDTDASYKFLSEILKGPNLYNIQLVLPERAIHDLPLLTKLFSRYLGNLKKLRPLTKAEKLTVIEKAKTHLYKSVPMEQPNPPISFVFHKTVEMGIVDVTFMRKQEGTFNVALVEVIRNLLVHHARQEGLVYYIEVPSTADILPIDSLAFRGMCVDTQKTLELLRVFREVFVRIVTEGLTADEIEEAKVLFPRFEKHSKSHKFEVNVDADAVEIFQMTPASSKEVFNKWFQDNVVTWVVLLPDTPELRAQAGQIQKDMVLQYSFNWTPVKYVAGGVLALGFAGIVYHYFNKEK